MYLIKRKEIIQRNIQYAAIHMLKNLHKFPHIPIDGDRAQA